MIKLLLKLVLLLVASGQECNENSARMRKNVLSMSQGEMDRYAAAVRQLNSGSRPTRWDYYANNHIRYFNSVHWNPWFLAWHRLYLHTIERELQAIDPNVTIPYWDWTAHAQNPASDPVLSSRLFGGSGHAQSGCVTTGYFRDFKTFYWHDGRQSTHCLIRSPNVYRGMFTSAAVVDHNYLSEPTIQGFATAIEGVPHSTAHNNIGGEFSGHASPGDPLFYSHHAFVDKLWFDWQNRHRDNYYDYPLSGNTNIAPWNMTVAAATDPVRQLCYYYPQEHFKYSSTTSPPRTTRQASYAPPANATDDQLLAHARQFILRGIPANVTVPEPLPLQLIRDMGFDLATIRNLERRDALAVAAFGTDLS